MKKRDFWHKKIESSLKERSIVWLAGVRRTGKTILSKSFDQAEYFDCELPSVRRRIEDPEAFWDGLRGKLVVIDEVHRLGDPSETLKIAADHYPDIKIIATGSSTFSASSKFRDSLSGRKLVVWLTPMNSFDLKDFGNRDMKHRFLRGGLPPFFLSSVYPEKYFQEWMDAYWAKDIQELFRLERKYSFQKFFELVMAQSGGIFEATRFARPCEVSRTTISNYLKILEETFVVNILRPFSGGRQNEIISAPKVYGFDTGFVCYHRGWNDLRDEDMGYLWEHFVLDEIYSIRQARDLMYWRDKQGHEIDIIIRNRKDASITAIECKWREKNFDGKNVEIFRKYYPDARIYVVSNDNKAAYSRKLRDATINFIGLSDLDKLLQK
jgi:predicted AAA+ superfamily ATPase